MLSSRHLRHYVRYACQKVALSGIQDAQTKVIAAHYADSTFDDVPLSL